MELELLRIGGERRRTQQIETVASPWDGSAVGQVCLGGAREVDDAIAAAHEAFARMRALPSHARASILERSAAEVERQAEALAHLMARESGKPIRFARAEVARAAITLKLGAEEARRLGGEVVPIDLEPRSEGRLCIVRRVPRGPVAAFAPFNFPLNLVAHKLAPAIAAGTTVVLKPPPQAPLCAFKLASILEQCGLPAGALSLVHCPPEVAQRLAEDERMRVLSFTGSDAVGWKLKSVSGKKQVLLELGGNAPCVVDETVPIESVLEPITLGAWGQAGQVCIKIQRVFVHASVFERFLEAFIARAKDVPCGDPLDERTLVGPLIEPRHVERVLGWVREAVAAGARLHCGGTSEGNVVHPTVLSGVPERARVVCDEVFGPVTVVESVPDFESALARCNATRFGLQAGVFTRDLGRALRAFDALDYGGVLINEVPTFRVDNYPYGGTKDSGLGREGVRWAVEELTEPRTLIVRAPPE